MTEFLFTDLGLAEPVQRAVSARNQTTPTAIQCAAIPRILEGRDILGIAQTGTGKTAAFALPMLSGMAHKPLLKKGRRHVCTLVLTPTRELALQIGNEIKLYSKYLKVFQAVIFGGVSQRPQVDKLRRGVDIIIATPGRLLDLMKQGHINLREVDRVVLDEADRMLDMGFIRDIRKIVTALPSTRQSMLFSATMPSDIAKLSQSFLKNPIRVEVTPSATPVELITQKVYHVLSDQKRNRLVELLNTEEYSKVVVFTRTKNRANRVSDYIQKAGINSTAIHGNKSQGARQRALRAFKAGEIQVLVATDIAARGIDVDGITHVINFDLPNEPETYVHRIGRTARAGKAGVAVALCDPNELNFLLDIERLIKMRLTVIGEAPKRNDFNLKDKNRSGNNWKAQENKFTRARKKSKKPFRHQPKQSKKTPNGKAFAA